MYKYVVFDVDGTMVDTEEAVMFAYQSVIFQKHGRYFTDQELLKGYGVPTRQSLERYGFTDIEGTIKDYYKYLIEGFKRCRTFDGIQELLDSLGAKNVPLAVVTSRCDYEIKIDTCLQGLLNKFAAVICSDDTVRHKPEAEPLQKAMERLGAAPDETLYVGDTLFDSQCAKNAGVKFALAIWGSNNSANIAADYYLKSPAQLLELLGQ
ncbi:pyrophosphatase PpaX [Ruminiclostridium hungatei]|uniref:Pyrophosphatase PpaX n=1 Tax=Ruminiclostridium hungatei TaxID=48256 RepID=A0A1V4SJL8_RUMHU|nr:HAD family hydrolase [Ruminiclostridium hungatei]OPX44014.1 pyrophosphatase PpaX [Ruminiclostridium hungatei]